MPAPTSSSRPRPRPTKKTPRERRHDRGDREAIAAAAADARDAKPEEPDAVGIYRKLVSGNVYDQKIRQAKRNGNYTPEWLRELNAKSGKPMNTGMTGRLTGRLAGAAAGILAKRMATGLGGIGSGASLLTGGAPMWARGLLTLQGIKK